MSALPAEDDAGLVARIIAGEHTLFERLVRRYNQRLYRAARSQVGDDATAQDVLQQAWLSIYRALGQWTGKGTFSGWALAIVINTCRRQRGPMSASIDDLDPDDEASALPGPEEATHRHQLQELLSRTVDALPVKLRTVLVLCDVEGLSGPEVSEALGVTEEAVRVRLHRARRSLRAALEAQLADQGRELFSFMGGRCDAMTTWVMQSIAEGDA